MENGRSAITIDSGHQLTVNWLPCKLVDGLQTRMMETHPYTQGMARPMSKARPKQGAKLAALRKAAGLSQAELADALGVPQSSVAYWETSPKPPRSDILPQMAAVLGVTVETIIGSTPKALPRRPGRVGKLQQALEKAAKLPRRQQQLVVEFVNTLVEQQRKAS